jgi:replicative superfamily II helicase
MMSEMFTHPEIDSMKSDDVTLSVIKPTESDQKEKPLSPPEFLTDNEMSSLNIPAFLQHSYLTGTPPPAIQKLRDWQISLLSTPEFKDGRSGIILVPTSGGKTIAADVAISHLLQSDPTAKAIYALPFVALANEKFNEFTQRFSPFSVHGFYQNVGNSDFRRGQIAVCTYEKAHSIVNSAISNKYSEHIQLLIIDEIHMIGDKQRGSVLEALIVKALLLSSQMRILGLTATVNRTDASRLANWIGGFEFISDSRPSEIKQYLATSDGQLNVLEDGNPIRRVTTLEKVGQFHGYVMDPIRKSLKFSLDRSVLIFVNIPKDTETLAEFISERLYDKIRGLPSIPPPSEKCAERRQKLIQKMSKAAGGIDERIRKCLLNGIGIHHAGLLLEERKLIEKAARKKTISILLATTTLSAGVNIPSVNRVLILNIYRNTSNGKQRIEPSQFTQMIGRAGRTDNQDGDAIIFAQTKNLLEIQDICQLSKQEIPDIIPHLRDAGELERFYLQTLSVGLVSGESGIQEFLAKTFCFKEENQEGIADAVNQLMKYQLINEKNHPVT